MQLVKTAVRLSSSFPLVPSLRLVLKTWRFGLWVLQEWMAGRGAFREPALVEGVYRVDDHLSAVVGDAPDALLVSAEPSLFHWLRCWRKQVLLKTVKPATMPAKVRVCGSRIAGQQHRPTPASKQGPAGSTDAEGSGAISGATGVFVTAGGLPCRKGSRLAYPVLLLASDGASDRGASAGYCIHWRNERLKLRAGPAAGGREPVSCDSTRLGQQVARSPLRP